MTVVYKNKKALIEAKIGAQDVVLDVGFWGQGVTARDENWPHRLIKERAQDVYGLDLNFGSEFEGKDRYFKMSAESFSVPATFDVIFAGDLIEHLSNPGLFLASCAKHLKPGGRLVLTTPNCFSFFSLTEKITKSEPTVNKDHTCYFNFKTLNQLLQKNNWSAQELSYIVDLEVRHRESLKKKILNLFYKLLLPITPKFIETIVVIAIKND